MTLEQQVCSLDLAKRLKELGVKQYSVFVWMESEGREMGTSLPFLVYKTAVGWYMQNGGGVGSFTIERLKQNAAFTVAELCGKLSGDGASSFSIEKDTISGWKIEYLPRYGGDWTREYDTSLANALAKMLIYLLENKLITL